MRVFLDSTVVLRVVFNEPDRLAEWGRWEAAYASQILETEAQRRIANARLAGTFDDESMARATIVLDVIQRNLWFSPITDSVLRRAGGAFGTTVKTLDAIHISTALLVRERTEPGLVFATHDRKQAVGAAGVGFEVVGVDI